MIISIFMVIHGGYTWSDSFGPGVTVFDTVSLSTCLLGASALFDMIYDESLRPLYVWHHLVMLLAIQGTLALIMSLTTSNEARLLATFEAIKVGLTWAQDTVPDVSGQLYYLCVCYVPRGSHRRLSPAYTMGTTPDVAGHSHSVIPGLIHDDQIQDSRQAVRGV
ncbi:hypothetical protein ASPSYDRAFT_55908 [Aspergillus sydowii CBS 593.65]|uniref:Uncharacterized protein n=1 Tax=Aspergillus sydowii CBS 593.65 TaxID=1036612 RepID=A0A1L9TLI9_9EURO|nr:uncharacterized protein ASPSYDRAFT_55908 [Aspergillus sydowii CBS 593.65]OJJ60294.1 hypothetical protein ASPSYDRAFT_55908 [Aspergillus sydowii CBS 593.65]